MSSLYFAYLLLQPSGAFGMKFVIVEDLASLNLSCVCLGNSTCTIFDQICYVEGVLVGILAVDVLVHYSIGCVKCIFLGKLSNVIVRELIPVYSQFDEGAMEFLYCC